MSTSNSPPSHFWKLPPSAETIRSARRLRAPGWAWMRDGVELSQRVAAIPVLPQAIALDNTFLLHHAAIHMVSAGGRALLALNRTLFRGPKYLDTTIAALDRKPRGYSDLAEELITQPGNESAAAYMHALEGFHPWSLDRAASLSVFIRDNELAWLTGILPPEVM